VKHSVGRRWAATLLWLVAAGIGLAADQPVLDIPFIDVEPQLEDFAGMQPAPHLVGKMAQLPEFIQRLPENGTRPSFRTDVFVAYNADTLYAVFVAFDDEPDKIRANLAPRGDVRNDDSVNIMIDTFNDQRRAYFFLSTPLGIQQEGQFTDANNFDDSFQAVWDSQARLTDEGYIVRIAIPFKSLRFPNNDEQTWRVIFNRTIPRLSEDTFWPEYSLAIDGRLNQTALLTGIRNISRGRNMQVVPFVFFRDFRLESETLDGRSVDDDNEESVGVDAKFVLRDALVLDVTANPDFSQIESDQPQVTANERFEVFFPELRPFFLENSDIFRTPINLLFTRRIADPSGGIKLTGKQGPWAIGALLADDDAPGRGVDAGDPLDGKSAQIGALRIARDVADQSRIGFLVTDRELKDSYNRVAAVDGRIRVDENWTANIQVANATTRDLDGLKSNGVAYNATLNRGGEHLSSHSHVLYTSPNFITDLGFLGSEQRPDSFNVHQRNGYTFRPEGNSLQAWGPRILLRRIWDTDGQPLETTIEPEIEWNWAANTRIQISYDHSNIRLTPEEFDALIGREDFDSNRWTFRFRTNRFERVQFNTTLRLGTRINFVPADDEAPALADFRRFDADALWRPISQLQLKFTLIHAELDNRQGSGKIFDNTIARVRANWQFTRELSLRLITDFESTDPVASRTSLTDEERVTADMLLRYRWNPWRALFIGYNSSTRDFREFDEMTTTFADLTDEGHQVFIKYSHLFQM